MKMLKNKAMAIFVAALLIFSMSASMILVLPANAHTPSWALPTYAYINVSPNPIGVGQTATVYMWLDLVFDNALLANNYRFHNYQLTITSPNGTSTTENFAYISDPTSSQLYTFTPTDVGTYTFNFTFPGQAINTYDHANDDYVNDTYLPSTTSTTLTVQQQAIPAAITTYPLPTSYWTRPIYGENTGWWSISSNWLGTGSPVISATGSGTISGLSNTAPEQRFPGDAVGSQTGHIMWTKPIQSGGVVGGNDYAVQGVGYFEGSAYQNRFTNPIILDGKLYYTEPVAFTGVTSGPTDCVDLRTGQLIWSRTDVPALSFGYIYNLYDPDQHGVFPPILVATSGGFGPVPQTWQLFDADTGDALFNVTNVPSGIEAMGPQGEQLRYVLQNAGTSANPQYYLAEWNSSKLWQYDINPYTLAGSLSPSIVNASNGALITTIPVPITGTSGTLPNGHGTAVPYDSTLTVDGNVPISPTTGQLTTYDWNVSVPWLNTMGASTIGSSPGANPVTVIAAFTGNVMLCRNGSLPLLQGLGSATAPPSQNPYTYFAVNLNASKGQVGSILWMNTVNPPPGNITVVQQGVDPTANNGAGVFVESYKETMQFVGYSLATGERLWGPTPSRTAFDYYGNPGTPDADSQVANGKLYASAFAGILYCYDLSNGNLLWTYGNGGEGNSTNAGLNVFYGHYPTYIQAVGNGIIYLATTEHTITDPIYKGSLTRAVNATDGSEIWTLSDYTGEFNQVSYAIADGYTTFLNGYDNQIYVVGRGPSQTTVSTPQVGVTTSTPVTIVGTVMDISAGTTQSQQAANFPNGVPVSSDASMKDWMGYVYQQKPEPTNFTGVPVTIAVTDSNGNCYDIGTATTDASGTYSLTWTPTIPGNFTVTATFAGNNGYWPSSAEAHFYAASTPTSTPVSTTSSTSGLATTTDLWMSIAVAVIIIVIAIAVIGLLMLRKKP